MRADHPVFPYLEWLGARQPLRLLKGLCSAHFAYPIAERLEHRDIRSKLALLRRHYRKPFAERLAIARERLADIICFSGREVPYYRDLFAQISFNPEMLRKDINYLQDIPFLTKDIIREHGERLLSRSLREIRHHACKTGGSTGKSVIIQYDQIAADYSAAVTLYCRERIGKKKYKPELHFACRFPEHANLPWPTREDFKCFAMNRSNIFFDRIDDHGLDDIWATLQRRRPYLIHEHPSTIYTLACHIEQLHGTGKAFDIFESSGELLQPYMREKIAKVLRCRVVDRYGLAELGVMAYELDSPTAELQVLESEGWPESRETSDGGHELVLTGFRNRLMPLIRYATGDRAQVRMTERAIVLTDVVGRIHDVVPINGTPHLTHHIMDMLDHRVGGIQEFQIDLRTQPPTLRIVPEAQAVTEQITARLETFWPGAFRIEYVGHDALMRVGHRAKFRHVVSE